MDFSTAIYTDGYTIVVPLKSEAQVWSFLEPLSSQVWFLSIVSTTLFLLAMGMAEYTYYGDFHWEKVSGFVLRNVFLENVDKLPDKTTYQRLFVITWIWCVFVVAQSYAGNLTAMITRPKLHMPITNVEEMLGQDEISLVVEEGVAVIDYMEASPEGSKLRELIGTATLLTDDGDLGMVICSCLVSHFNVPWTIKILFFTTRGSRQR